MTTRSPRLAAVALLSAAFTIMAAGSGNAQHQATNTANSAVRSAITDARDAAFRTRDAALARDASRAHRHAALRGGHGGH